MHWSVDLEMQIKPEWDGESFSAQRTKRKLKRQRGSLPVRPKETSVLVKLFLDVCFPRRPQSLRNYVPSGIAVC